MTFESERKICTFTGHRPERLNAPEQSVRNWLKEQIDIALSDGFADFIAGMQRGVDIWAAEEVLRRKKEDSSIRFIAASAFKGMETQWESSWIDRYNSILEASDQVIYVGDKPGRKAFYMRDKWMVNHADRIIAVYTGLPGGTKKTLEYAEQKEIEIVRYRV